LFLNQFYPPDVAPTGRLLSDVAHSLAGRGHQVRVMCSKKSYAPGRANGSTAATDGIEVCRLRALPLPGRSLLVRMLDDASFLLQAGVAAILTRPRPDIVVAAASPPLLGLMAALAARVRRIPYVLWTMDVYPEALQADWSWARRGPVALILRALARLQSGRSVLVLTLGEEMADRMRPHVRTPSVVEVVPIWSDVAAAPNGAAEALRAERGWGAQQLVLLYSGNMGRGHRVGEFLEAARRLGANGPTWAFLGGGPRRSEVERFRREHPAARVEILPYVPDVILGASLRSADVHLVSLSRRWQGLIVPSKLQAAFAVGRPVLFVGPTNNEIARWVRESGGGWVVDEGDVDAILRVVAAARDPEERRRRGEAAAEFGRRHFDRATNRQRIAELLEGAAR
jgi:colanic acid biosynthesis glycosyl transferase WcaI